MTYQEALARTIKLKDYAAEYNHTDVEYIVVPADYNEMETFLSDYNKLSGKQNEFDCKEYCSDGKFSVYRIDEGFNKRKSDQKQSSVKR